MSRSTTTFEAPAWHQDLIDFRGLIRARAAAAYHYLKGADRDDAVADVTADVTVAFAKLGMQRETHRGLIPPLINYAIRQLRDSTTPRRSQNRHIRKSL